MGAGAGAEAKEGVVTAAPVEAGLVETIAGVEAGAKEPLDIEPELPEL